VVVPARDERRASRASALERNGAKDCAVIPVLLAVAAAGAGGSPTDILVVP
jgi:hypothetical protein